MSNKRCHVLVIRTAERGQPYVPCTTTDQFLARELFELDDFLPNAAFVDAEGPCSRRSPGGGRRRQTRKWYGAQDNFPLSYSYAHHRHPLQARALVCETKINCALSTDSSVLAHQLEDALRRDRAATCH
jgi:hypothetical protein